MTLQIENAEARRLTAFPNRVYSPVDARDDGIHSKRAVVDTVLAPDGAVGSMALTRTTEGVVDAGDDQQKPGNGGAELVGQDGFAGVVVPAGERVDWIVCEYAFLQRSKVDTVESTSTYKPWL